MSSKLKYWLFGIILLASTVIGFHFYAASRAESQITDLIKMETAKAGTLSVQYSDLEVTPFTGRVIFTDLSIFFGNHIERARKLTVDLDYLDVLKFYLGGTQYALENLHRAEALLVGPSYVNKSSLRQISSDSLHLDFEGLALDGIRAAVGDTAFSHNQQVRATGSKLSLQLAGTMLTKFTARTFSYEGSVAAGTERFWQEGTHEITMDSLSWTPQESFQNNYRFFLQGFGYKTDAIPLQSVHFQSTPQPRSDFSKVEAELKSELALFAAGGLIDLRSPVGSSALKKAQITVTNLSPSFKRVLENIERLLSISLPRNSEGIIINIEGTLADPRIAEKAGNE